MHVIYIYMYIYEYISMLHSIWVHVYILFQSTPPHFNVRHRWKGLACSVSARPSG